MSTNHLGFQARLAAGKQQEARIMYDLQRKFWSVIPATVAQDMHDKIDCWVRWKGVSYSVAIKWRESGTDLGVALIRPYESFDLYVDQWHNDELPYDRDAQHFADLYAVGLPSGLVIVTGASVAAACRLVENELAETAIETATRRTLSVPGVGEAKLVTDKGASGHTSGQQKIIAYLLTENLERVEV